MHQQILNELYKKGSFDEMISFCNDEFEKGKSSYLLYGARGRAFYELKKYEFAVSDLSKAIELFPTYATGFFNRSQCYIDLEKYDLAILDIEKAHSIDTERHFYELLGFAYAKINDHARAIENYSLFLLDYVDNEVSEWKAFSHVCLNQLQEALKEYESILLTEIVDIEKVEKINEISNDIINEELVATDNLEVLKMITQIGFSNNTNNYTSGIYILQFTNKEYYIGQTIKIENRLKQHFKKFDDINYVYFKPVHEEFLLDEENKIISFFENQGIRIRNLKQINFKNIFNNACQKEWITNSEYNYLSGSKFDNEKVRGKYSERFRLLQGKSYFSNLVSTTSIYLKASIPNYIASEYNYWSITCLPKYLVKENCISRININAIPVLSFYANENGTLNVMLFVSKLPFLSWLQTNKQFETLFDNIPSLKLEIRNAFEVTEGDEITLFMEESDFINALNNEVIRSAIRLFNLRMMNKTGKEDTYRRSIAHCLDLSDLIVK